MRVLHVGAPVVRQSVFGDWLVDDGSLVPQHANDRCAAFAEAAARVVPPAGDPLTHPGKQIATPGVAGSDRSHTASAADGEDPRRSSHPVTVPADRDGCAPGPAASPRHLAGPGATKRFHGCEGEVGVPVFVGPGTPTSGPV